MMNWSNVKLVISREVRDQLRDRRTLFMIAVLPLLLYPLLGMSVFQISQFMRERPSKIFIIGAKHLADSPPLVENRWFSPDLFADPQGRRLLELEFARDERATGPTRGMAIGTRIGAGRRGWFRDWGGHDGARYPPARRGERAAPDRITRTAVTADGQVTTK